MPTTRKQPTREEWMNDVAASLAPEFAGLGFPLPPFRISCGFTSKGRNGRAAAECWTDKADADNHHQIFIDPRDDNPFEVVNSITHELIHAAVGLNQRHGGEFARVALALGMMRPMTMTPSGPEFIELAGRILAKVGPYPHARLQIGRGRGNANPIAPIEPGAPVSTVISTGGKPQTARLVKAACGGCGYTVRVTRKWLDVAAPDCPNPGCDSHGHPMKIG